MKSKSLYIIFFIFIQLLARINNAAANNYPWLQPGTYNKQQSIDSKITPPEDYKRIPVEKGSFAEWLRDLPLLPLNSELYEFPTKESGKTIKRKKENQNFHYAIINMDVMKYQQCADAIIRLRAEYSWSVNKSEEICFKYTSGDELCWREWKEGWRTEVKGSKVTKNKSGEKNNSREEFTNYVQDIINYAGTISLSRYVPRINSEQPQIGDFFVESGSPGHAVLILDMVKNDEGKKLMLLGQSYTPARQFHILKNPDNNLSPWYKVNFGDSIKTPEWSPFTKKHLRTFNSKNPHFLALKAYALLAKQYADTEEIQKEVEVYRSALNPFFDVSAFHFNLSQLLIKKGQIKNAIYELMWATNVDPENPNLREISFKMFEIIDENWNRCTNDNAYNQENKELCLFLDAYGLMRSGPGNFESAIGKYKKCLEINSNQLLCKLYLGELYYKVGFYKEAVSYLSDVSSELNYFGRGHLELGDAYYKLYGASGRARHYWSRASESLVPWVREQADRRLKALARSK